jgi:hypothetical protein
VALHRRDAVAGQVARFKVATALGQFERLSIGLLAITPLLQRPKYVARCKPGAGLRQDIAAVDGPLQDLAALVERGLALAEAGEHVHGLRTQLALERRVTGCSRGSDAFAGSNQGLVGLIGSSPGFTSATGLRSVRPCATA